MRNTYNKGFLLILFHLGVLALAFLYSPFGGPDLSAPQSSYYIIQGVDFHGTIANAQTNGASQTRFDEVVVPVQKVSQTYGAAGYTGSGGIGVRKATSYKHSNSRGKEVETVSVQSGRSDGVIDGGVIGGLVPDVSSGSSETFGTPFIGSSYFSREESFSTIRNAGSTLAPDAGFLALSTNLNNADGMQEEEIFGSQKASAFEPPPDIPAGDGFVLLFLYSLGYVVWKARGRKRIALLHSEEE